MEDLLLNRQELSHLQVRWFDAAYCPPWPRKRDPVAGAAAVQQSLMVADFHKPSRIPSEAWRGGLRLNRSHPNRLTMSN
jgi:hypothetical protein